MGGSRGGSERLNWGLPRALYSQRFLTRCGCPVSESALSLLWDSLLAWQRGPAILTVVSASTSWGHDHEHPLRTDT